MFVYYATRPIHRRIVARSPSRNLAAGAALTLIALPVIALVVYTAAIALTEFSTVTGSELAAYESVLQPYLGRSTLRGGSGGLFSTTVDRLQGLQGLDSLGTPGTLRDVLVALGSYAQAVALGLLQVFVAFVVAFYLLRDDRRLAGWFRTALGDERSTVYAYATAVDRDLQTIYFGNILNAFVVAIVSALSFNALNLIAPAGFAIPVPTLLGLLTGVASLVPVVGMKLVYVPVGIYLLVTALVTDGALVWFPVAFLLVSLVVVDGLTEVLLRPYISGRDLHVGLVLFAYVVGPVAFGWYGLFLGPLLLVLAVHLVRIVVPELVHGEPVTPEATGADPIPDSYPTRLPDAIPDRFSTGPDGSSESNAAGDDTPDGSP